MDDISDPLGDRVMKSVPPLARFPLKQSEIWHISGEYLIKKWESHCKPQSHAKLPFICLFQAVQIVIEWSNEVVIELPRPSKSNLLIIDM